jgi:hypothetical protein
MRSADALQFRWLALPRQSDTLGIGGRRPQGDAAFHLTSKAEIRPIPHPLPSQQSCDAVCSIRWTK